MNNRITIGMLPIISSLFLTLTLTSATAQDYDFMVAPNDAYSSFNDCVLDRYVDELYAFHDAGAPANSSTSDEAIIVAIIDCANADPPPLGQDPQPVATVSASASGVTQLEAIFAALMKAEEICQGEGKTFVQSGEPSCSTGNLAGQTLHSCSVSGNCVASGTPGASGPGIIQVANSPEQDSALDKARDKAVKECASQDKIYQESSSQCAILTIGQPPRAVFHCASRGQCVSGGNSSSPGSGGDDPGNGGGQPPGGRPGPGTSPPPPPTNPEPKPEAPVIPDAEATPEGSPYPPHVVSGDGSGSSYPEALANARNKALQAANEYCSAQNQSVETLTTECVCEKRGGGARMFDCACSATAVCG